MRGITRTLAVSAAAAALWAASCPAAGESISINCKGHSATISGTATSGFVAVENRYWNEINGAKTTVSLSGLVDNIGVITTARFKALTGGSWGLSQTGGMNLISERTNRLGAMGDGYYDAPDSGTGGTISISDVPYTQYDLIIYCATDNSEYTWHPVKVTDASNNVAWYSYTGRETATEAGVIYATESPTKPANWGSTSAIAEATNTATYGKDVIRISGLSGDITVSTGEHTDSGRGGYCGLQIVNTGNLITGSTFTALTSDTDVTFGAINWNEEGGLVQAAANSAEVTLAPGATLRVTEAVTLFTLKVISSGDVTIVGTEATLAKVTKIDATEVTGTATLVYTNTSATPAIPLLPGVDVFKKQGTAAFTPTSNAPFAGVQIIAEAGTSTFNLDLTGMTATAEKPFTVTGKNTAANFQGSGQNKAPVGGTLKVTNGATLGITGTNPFSSSNPVSILMDSANLAITHGDGNHVKAGLVTLSNSSAITIAGTANAWANEGFVLLGNTNKLVAESGDNTVSYGKTDTVRNRLRIQSGTIEVKDRATLTVGVEIASGGENTTGANSTITKTGAGLLKLVGSATPGRVNASEGTLDLGTSRPAVTVTGEGTTLVLLQGLDDVADGVTPSPISLSFADGIESCTVVTKSFGGVTKTLTISSRDVTDGTVSVTFPMETDILPTAHRTCGFEDSNLTGLLTSGMQNMAFAASPFPGQGNYGQIGSDGRPHSKNNDDNGFLTATDERGFTFSLKVRPNTCTNKGVLFSFGQQANAVALLWQDDTDSTKGRFAVYSVKSTGGANTPIVTSQLVTKDAWHAVSVVSSLETKRFYITVDGTMANSAVLSNGLLISNGAFQVGSVHAGLPTGWNNGDGAQVDDFRFDKVPLTQPQIARLLFHHAEVRDGDDSTLTGLKEFGSGTQVAWANLKATADARIFVDEGVTATATLTAPTAATLKVWGAGTLEVAKGESAQTIAEVELKEANTTLLLHRSQAEVVTSRVGTMGTFKFDGGTKEEPLEVPYNVAFPGAIAVAADSCVRLACTTGSDDVSYQVSGAGQSSKVILTSDHDWGVLNGAPAVTSSFHDLTLSIGGDYDFRIRAGLTNNVWLDIPTGRTVTQEADASGTTDGILTVRNLTGGGNFNSLNTDQTLRLLNTDPAASTFNGDPTINDGGSNFKLVFAGKWQVGAALTDAKTPPIIHIGDGTTETTVETAVAFAPGAAYTVQAKATLRPTAAAAALPASLTLAEGGKVQLTLDSLTLPSALSGTGTVLFGNGTDTFAYTLASAPANFTGTYNVPAKSTLTLTSAPNEGAGFAGSGTLVLGNGTKKTSFTSTKAYLDVKLEDLQSLTVQVKPSATLTLNPGADKFAFPNATIFDVEEGAELILASGMSFFGVSGAGSCSVTGNYLFGVSSTAASAGFPDAAKVLNVATLTVGTDTNPKVTFSVRPFGAIAIAPTKLKVNQNAVIARDSYKDAKADASLSIGATATVTGEGTIELPVAFTEGATLDTVTAAPLLLKGKVTGLIKVKLNTAKAVLSTTSDVEFDRNTLLAFASDDTSQEFARDGYRFAETVFGITHTFAVVPPLTLPGSLPEAVSGNAAAQDAIYDAVAAIGSDITSVTAVTAQSTGGVTGNVEALALFKNLHALATIGEQLGDGTFPLSVTVYYDFGISQLHVKRASLGVTGDPQLYVLLCAKVATKQDTSTADYAGDTTVSLLLGGKVCDGTEGNGPKATELTDEQLQDLVLTRDMGERWFAVPMKNLGVGTHDFTVSATNTTP